MVIPVNCSEAQTMQEVRESYFQTIDALVKQFKSQIPDDVELKINSRSDETEDEKLLRRYMYLRDIDVVGLKKAKYLEKLCACAFFPAS